VPTRRDPEGIGGVDRCRGALSARGFFRAGRAALVVEILYPGTRKTDEQAKRQLFDRGGVREYWIVDPERDAVRVFRRQADRSFPQSAEHSGRDVLTTPLLPGLEIRLTDLFA
jgi:Uma2 family endonuclease